MDITIMALALVLGIVFGFAVQRMGFCMATGFAEIFEGKGRRIMLILLTIFMIEVVLFHVIGEAGENKSCIVHTDQGYERIPIDIGFKFHNLPSLKSIDKVDLVNFFKIDIESEELGHSIFSRYNIFPNVIKNKKDKVRLELESSDDKDIEKYIELSKTNLDKEILLKIGKELL